MKIGDLGDTPIIPVILLFIGAYFAWFGVHYWRRDVTWPSDPVKSVLQGKGLPARGPITTAQQMISNAESQATAAATSKSTGSIPVPGQASGNAAKNQNIGKLLAAKYGWTGSQWNALVDLWNRESGWNQFATNPSSGAYGIPQSLPADKMASAGSDWKTNPATQIKWGLSYIKGRYGSPAGAWAHEQANGWY